MVNNPALDIAQEFPEYKEKVHILKASNPDFRHMYDEYHSVNHKIHRIEQEIETVSDDVSENLKKKRLQLKDGLFDMLRKI